MVGMSRLCTVRIGSSTRAGRIDGDDIVILDAADVGDVLRADSEVAETGEAILENRPPGSGCHCARQGGVRGRELSRSH